jgi:ABC-type transport system involved in multi-copper enzyme maturation permease subunit
VFSFPVIERELRVEARKRATYWLRAWAGLGAVLVLIGAALFGAELQNGSYIFALIHIPLALMLVLIAPVTSADAISRERREGTLGLLFLTPLTARQIVSGKFAVRVFRLFYLWLLFVPLLMLPMLTGGLAPETFLLSIAILLCLLFSSLAAGMIASAMSTSFAAAVIRALFFTLIVNVAISGLAVSLPKYLFDAKNDWNEPWVIRFLLMGPYFLFFPAQILEALRWTFASSNLIWAIASPLVICSLLFFRFSMWFCTRRITRYAEANIETVRKAALRRRFLTPVLWKDRFRASMRRTLQNNPFMWLEYRGAWARALRWAALLALIGFESLYITQLLEPTSQSAFVGLFEAHIFLLWILLLTITLKSTTSFQYERESGAIELILVTPITEWNLVVGRLTAVLRYYLPIILAMAVFTFIAWQLETYHNAQSFHSAVNLWLSVFSIPVVGLFFALRCKTYLPALLWTSALSIFAAPLLWAVWKNLAWFAAYRMEWRIGYLLNDSTGRVAPWLPSVAYPLYHLALIAIFLARAVSLLQRRAFADQRSN